MPNQPALRPSMEVVVLTLLAGFVYALTHLLNGWLFQSLEFSSHISLLYLPGFLRLAHVLVLGLFWGTLATATGGLLLSWWASESLLAGLSHTMVSASSALLAVILMRMMQGRHLAITRMTELLQLAAFYALMNALVHHLMWSWFAPDLLIAPPQMVYMAIGDFNGAIVGALVLRWLARNTKLVHITRKRADSIDS